MIRAEVIADSTAANAPRLHTQRWTHPSFNHQEVLRHRKIYLHDQLAMAWEPDLSFSVSSSRAIPFAKLLEEVRSGELRAAPVFWGSEKKGMSPGDEVPNKHTAKIEWALAAHRAADSAEALAALGLHKSIVNRIIAPFVHTHCLATATEPGWLNFFGLRLDRAADPTLRALAEAAWAAWNESKPRKLVPGRWHLPYIDADDREAVSAIGNSCLSTSEWYAKSYDLLIKISVARCARLSYASFDTGKRSTMAEDLALYDRLLGSLPIHASPAEHQATPDAWKMYGRATDHSTGKQHEVANWEHAEQAGNLGPGWRQYRKMIPGEAVAPLPEAYR